MKTKTILTVVCLTVLPLLAACNTMEGMGTDISKGGNKIEKRSQSK